MGPASKLKISPEAHFGITLFSEVGFQEGRRQKATTTKSRGKNM